MNSDYSAKYDIGEQVGSSYKNSDPSMQIRTAIVNNFSKSAGEMNKLIEACYILDAQLRQHARSFPD